MKKSSAENTTSPQTIIGRILTIRGKRVMLDRDLAELYSVTTKSLNQQVKRNMERFPEDFMFQLTEQEKNEVVTICDHLRGLKYSPFLPYAFTEHGAVMLASVLNSRKAIEMNVIIVRVFNQMREAVMHLKDVEIKMDKIETRLADQENKVDGLFEYVKELAREKSRPRKKIGYKIPRKNE